MNPPPHLKPQVRTPAELVDAARDVICKAKFPMLATVGADGSPKVRPISPLRVDDGFTISFANLRSYGKTADILANPAVELCYMDDRHFQVRISGRAEEITNFDEKADLWDSSPLLRKYLGSLNNPELVLYRVIPSRVRFMQEWALEYEEVPLAD